MAEDKTPAPGDPPKPLLPLHCVDRAGVVRVVRRTGRPKTVRPAPDAYALEYAAENDRRRQQFVAEEASRLEAEPEGIDRVWVCLRMLAEEAAALKFERRRLEREDREGTAQVSSRIVETYGRMAALICALRKFDNGDRVDPYDPRVQLLVRVFFEEARAAAEETLGAGADSFIARVNERIAGWEERLVP